MFSTENGLTVEVTKFTHEKKFGAHTHFTQHMTTKCCNITTTVNNASTTTINITESQNSICVSQVLTVILIVWQKVNIIETFILNKFLTQDNVQLNVTF